MLGWFFKEKPAGRYLRWGRVSFALIIAISAADYLFESVYNPIGRDLQPQRARQYLDSIQATTEKAQRPNIVIILADDLGYGDLSITGSKAIATPNIDTLAAQGTLFSNYYSPSPVCSPSRAGLLTGRYPTRAHVPTVFLGADDLTYTIANRAMLITNIYSYDMEAIAHDEILLSETLQAGGYRTALFGKWHLGQREGDRPNDYGFDNFYGALYSNDMKPYAIYRNRDIAIKAPADQSLLTRKLTAEAINFIEENNTRPFFLYYASPFPHNPANASSGFRGSSRGGIYGDAVQELDWSIGEIIKTLKQCGLDRNTLVLFTSDNGPWFQGDPGPFRGRKGNSFSGGQRVPLIAWMPGTVPQNQQLKQLVSGLDIFPTVLDLASIPLPRDRVIDGHSLLRDFAGSAALSDEREFVLLNGKDIKGLVTNKYIYLRKSAAENATYSMFQQGPFLFDPTNDPAQSYNLTTLYPDIADQYASRLDEIEKSMRSNLRGWIVTNQ